MGGQVPGEVRPGWDAYREETFERQKRLGVVPAEAKLTPRNPAFPAWDRSPEDQKRLYARQMEVYAGYCENADWNAGRVIAAIEEMGELDNTLVIYIYGDNGASMEGTLTGSFNELTMQNGIPLTPEQQLALIQLYGGLDVWGSDMVAPHYSTAWAWAGNSPFQWGKQVASHLGGTRQAMAVRYPRLITDAGGLRSQFTHCIDIGPTILELAGLPQPTQVDGVVQQPMHGTSFLHTFADPDAAERHTQQYFEKFGNRAMYKDGWWLPSRSRASPGTSPRSDEKFAPGVWHPDDDPVELYYLPDDFSQADNMAAQHPEKVAELQELFWAEAEKYKVLPLLGGISVYFGLLPPRPAQTTYTYHGDVQNIASGMIPPDLQPLLHDLGRPGDTRGRRRGRDRGRGRPPGRLLAVRRRGQAQAHLLDDGRTGLPAGIRHALPAGEVNVRLEFHADAATPATAGTYGCSPMDRKSARAGWTTACRSGSPPMRAWTSVGTTAALSTATTRTGRRSH